MNERIKKLAKQAEIDIRHIEKNADEDFGDCIEKFAELIVKECADIVFNKATLESNEDYREGFHRAKQFIWQDINKHFGVKE